MPNLLTFHINFRAVILLVSDPFTRIFHCSLHSDFFFFGVIHSTLAVILFLSA